MLLAGAAGAVNAGGFLAVGRYTSHMSGIVSGIADDLVLGSFRLALSGVALVCFFLSGSITTALLTNWARQRQLHSEFAVSLLLEALLLLLFGSMGPLLSSHQALLVPVTAALLCFIMGLQNAVMTKISHAEIRTTHMTGIITDLGIELGRLVFWNRGLDSTDARFVRANREKLAIHAAILSAFLLGGLAGALAFKYLSYLATVPVALLLMGLASGPLLLDLKRRWQAA